MQQECTHPAIVLYRWSAKPPAWLMMMLIHTDAIDRGGALL
jgi:hypothetical protein